ncbi:MAG: hypothetical protein A2293_03925 [Elusimicrobia bacterium RIFOXYB2_FULL_49_7]|nr:MAG: hypothetical protein A2293_03925 [Elusimicrobia bacterium RIFOXYB2_FULL_49_7]
MKKILLVNWRDIKNPEAGGAEIYYHEIFKRLAKADYAVTVLSHGFSGAPAQEIVEETHIIRIGSRSLFNFSAMIFIKRHETEFDLIIEDLNKIPFYTPLFVKKPRLHLVMHFFGTQIFREASWPLAAYVYGQERLISRMYRAERFVAISESTAREVRAFCHHSNQVDIVEPGVDTAFFKPVLKKEATPLLFTVTRLKRYKNVQFLLECLPAIARAVPAVRLVVAGTGDYEKTLKKICQEKGVEKRVDFVGYVTEEQKREWLSRATLFVNPSMKEGWGITNIEANLCGTISLSSNVGGLRDSVQHEKTGLLYRPEDKADFTAKAVALLQDTEKRSELEENGLSFASGFSWDTMAQHMVPCIERALNHA